MEALLTPHGRKDRRLLIATDMDNCIAAYQVSALENLIFDGVVEYFIQKHNADASLSTWEMKEEHLVRGIIIAKETGDLLQLDERGYIKHARHGLTDLSDEEIRQKYGPHQSFSMETILNKDLYVIAHSFFERPIFDFYARAVDAIESHGPQFLGYPSDMPKSELYKSICNTISGEAFTHLYATFRDSSPYFSTLRTQTERFLIKDGNGDLTGPIASYFLAMREFGAKVVLVSNGLIQYTELVMQFCFGPTWRTLFDLVIAEAGKPAFFSHSTFPFYMTRETISLDRTPVTEVVSDAPMFASVSSPLVSLTKGCAKQLQDYFKLEAHECVYFGDHLVADVWAPRSHRSWKTVAVVEEIGWSDDDANVWQGNFLDFQEDCSLTYWGHLVRSHADLLVPSMESLARSALGAHLGAIPRSLKESCTYWGPRLGPVCHVPPFAAVKQLLVSEKAEEEKVE